MSFSYLVIAFGVLFTCLGSAWILKSNSLPRNAYRTLLNSLCYAWIIGSVASIALKVLQLLSHNDSCINSANYTSCSIWIQLLSSVTDMCIFVSTFLSIILCLIPWYLSVYNGNTATLDGKVTLILIATLSISSLKFLNIFQSQITNIIALTPNLVLLVLMPIMIIGGIRTWFRLKAYKQQPTMFDYEQNDNIKVMFQLSSTLITIAIVNVFLDYLLIGLMSSVPLDGQMNDSNLPIFIILTYYLNLFILSSKGGLFVLFTYNKFTPIVKTIQRQSSIEKVNIQTIPVAPTKDSLTLEINFADPSPSKIQKKSSFYDLGLGSLDIDFESKSTV
ncbi:hypothetical protein BC833DRAFT_660590 [Globomyces pollinis-pini]|nr:hypothetical protein BC833DRAFT_660590 [Globomyces pollinis-pini]